MVKKLFSEFLGTFTLIFLGAGSIVAGKADLQGIAFAHGLAIFVMVSAFAGISGAHFNPAVSVAMFVTGRLAITELFYFVIAQIAGGAAASALLKSIFGSSNGYGLPALAAEISVSSGVLAEAIGTALLVLVIFGVAVDKRGPFASISGLPIGLTITAVILAIGPATGAALNPARWFGPALIAGDWTDIWLYIGAPIVGAVLAGSIYQLVAKPD